MVCEVAIDSESAMSCSVMYKRTEGRVSRGIIYGTAGGQDSDDGPVRVGWRVHSELGNGGDEGEGCDGDRRGRGEYEVEDGVGCLLRLKCGKGVELKRGGETDDNKVYARQRGE